MKHTAPIKICRHNKIRPDPHFGCSSFSGGQALLGIVGIYFVARTLDKTSDAVDTARTANLNARELGEIQMRAYVDMSQAKAEFFPATREVKFMGILKNNGQTPARNVRTWSTIRIDKVLDASLAQTSDNRTSENPLGSGGELKIEYSSLERRVGLDSTAPIRTGAIGLWVIGLIVYSDVFGNQRSTSFRFQADQQIGADNKIRLNVTSDGNVST